MVNATRNPFLFLVLTATLLLAGLPGRPAVAGSVEGDLVGPTWVAVTAVEAPSAPPGAELGWFEAYNRWAHGFNVWFWTPREPKLMPEMSTWLPEWWQIPESVVRGLEGISSNLHEPVTAIASTLQGDFVNAWIATKRFALNTLFGLGGVFDLARGHGWVSRNEDMGQVLCYWGVPQGPYIVLPLIGGGSLREVAGRFMVIGGGFGLFGRWYIPIRMVDRASVMVKPRERRRAETQSFDDARGLYMARRRNLCQEVNDAWLGHEQEQQRTAPPIYHYDRLPEGERWKLMAGVENNGENNGENPEAQAPENRGQEISEIVSLADINSMTLPVETLPCFTGLSIEPTDQLGRTANTDDSLS